VKGGRFWIGFVVALLVGNAAAMVFLIAKAGDPTPRVLPDYYRRAVAWDETAAVRRASAALGWSAEATWTDQELVVVLTDASGAPIRGATVAIVARHRSRADRRASLALSERGDGRYAGTLAAEQAGLHELEVTASRGSDTFVSTQVVER
jgi:nitrogen fixation protein FixH